LRKIKAVAVQTVDVVSSTARGVGDDAPPLVSPSAGARGRVPWHRSAGRFERGVADLGRGIARAGGQHDEDGWTEARHSCEPYLQAERQCKYAKILARMSVFRRRIQFSD
jgi:hypothetical protein